MKRWLGLPLSVCCDHSLVTESVCVCVYESVCVCVCRGSRGVPCFGSTAHCFRPGLKTVWPCSSETVHLGTKEMCLRCAYHVVGEKNWCWVFRSVFESYLASCSIQKLSITVIKERNHYTFFCCEIFKFGPVSVCTVFDIHLSLSLSLPPSLPLTLSRMHRSMVSKCRLSIFLTFCVSWR